jgi:hypothetical protein
MRKHDRWMYRIVRDSKASDYKAGRVFTPEEYITTEDLIKMQETQKNQCYYCSCFMDWLERRTTKTGLTCERRHNSKPHLVSNVVLCCKSCNSKKYNYRKGLLKRYFSLWFNHTFDIVAPRTNRRCSFIM